MKNETNGTEIKSELELPIWGVSSRKAVLTSNLTYKEAYDFVLRLPESMQYDATVCSSDVVERQRESRIQEE